MNKGQTEMIKREADKVREKLSNSRLMGEPIDINDSNQIIWCAYMMGKQEAEYRAYKDMELLKELHQLSQSSIPD